MRATVRYQTSAARRPGWHYTRNVVQTADIALSIERRTGLADSDWDTAYRLGRATPIEDALSKLARHHQHD